MKTDMLTSLSFIFRRKITTILVLFLSTTVFGQLTGTKYIPGNYSSVSAAVLDVNTLGVGTGGVTFNVAAGYTENITGVISLSATGTVANQIVFQKDPATTGVNPLITAYNKPPSNIILRHPREM